MALTCSSSSDDEMRVCKDVNSTFDSVCVFLRGYQTLTASEVNCPFFTMSQTRRTLSCSDCFAMLVQLLFQVIDDDGLDAISILQSINQILQLGHPLLVFVDDVLWYSMNSEIDTKRVPLAQHCLGKGPRTVSRCSFPPLLKTSCCCCCCCCLCQVLLRTIRGASLSVEDRW